MTDLLVRPTNEIQVGGGNQIAGMIQTLIDKGITADNVTAMDKLADLFLKMEAENARKEFAVAKCALHAEMPKIIAKRPVLEKDSNKIRYTFAAFEDIMAAIDPYLARHGFSVHFSTRVDAADRKDRICAICTLTHISGHSASNEFSVRTSGPPGTSDAQADGATLSYAKRYALCLMLNLSIDHDNDARLEGGFITQELADALRDRVHKCGADEAKFLKLARAESYELIRTGNYAMLDHNLRRKETSPVPPAVTPATEAPSSPESAAGDSIQESEQIPDQGPEASAKSFPDCPAADMPVEKFIDLVAGLTGLDMGEAAKRYKKCSLGAWPTVARSSQESWWGRFRDGKLAPLKPVAAGK